MKLMEALETIKNECLKHHGDCRGCVLEDTCVCDPWNDVWVEQWDMTNLKMNVRDRLDNKS